MDATLTAQMYGKLVSVWRDSSDGLMYMELIPYSRVPKKKARKVELEGERCCELYQMYTSIEVPCSAVLSLVRMMYVPPEIQSAEAIADFLYENQFSSEYKFDFEKDSDIASDDSIHDLSLIHI